MLPWVIGGAAGLAYLLGRAIFRRRTTGVTDGAPEPTNDNGRQAIPPSEIAFWITCEASSYSELQNQLPKDPGVYACYFSEVPGALDVRGCFQNGEWTLMYVGKAKSLRSRVLGDHFNGFDATQSGAIRETVGALLGMHIHRKDRGDVWTFGASAEKLLTAWLRENMRVAWVSLNNQDVAWPDAGSQDEKLRLAEERLIDECFDLPLNRNQKRAAVAAQALMAWNKCKASATPFPDEA
jgi:hypothetical protein